MTLISDQHNDATDPSFTIDISVHNGHCHLFAICQQEAPEVFELVHDRRLIFTRRPEAHLLEKVRNAARLCPMQAIEITQNL